MTGMKGRRLGLAAAAALLVATGLSSPSATVAGGDQAPLFGTGRAVVLLSTPEVPSGLGGAFAVRRWRVLRSRSQEILDRVAGRNRLEVRQAVPEIGMLSVELGAGGLRGLRRQLADDPRVETVEPDPAVERRYWPNDPGFTRPDVHAPGGDLGQWNLIRSNGPRGWDLSKGQGAEVAIVDFGTDGSHPDLAPRIVGAQGFGVGSPTVDTNGHGTHTAGLACADSDNAFGIASLGFDCDLFIARIGGSCSDVAAAVTAAADRLSDVISMSIGGCKPAINAALSYALGRGSILVTAGDNSPIPDNSCPFPDLSDDCAYPSEWIQPEGTGPNSSFNRGLVVTAAKYDGTRASFAQMTSGVSVAAFGAASDLIGGQQGILSTWPASASSPCNAGRTFVDGSNRFAYCVGTSMATPQVAGLAALIRSARPNMIPSQVTQLIKATASGCGSYGGGIGWGVVRADQAVAAALGKDVDPPQSRVRSAKRARRSRLATAARAGRIINLRLKRSDPAAPNCAVKLPSSGVKSVAVFASANGGAYHRIGKTRKKKLRFHAKPRRDYRFYSVAVDTAGNREAAPPGADAKFGR